MQQTVKNILGEVLRLLLGHPDVQIGALTGASNAGEVLYTAASGLEVIDEEKALIIPAKIFALSVYHLLKNNAELAKQEIAEYKPVFTKQGYKEYVATFK